MESGREERRVKDAGSAYTYLSPNGRFLLLSAGRRIIDQERGRTMDTGAGGFKAAVSPDSRYFFYRQGRAVVKFDMRTGEETARRDVTEDNSGLSWEEVSPDGRTLALALSGGRILLVDTRTLEVRRELEVEGAPSLVLGFTRNGAFLIAITSSGKVLRFRGR